MALTDEEFRAIESAALSPSIDGPPHLLPNVEEETERERIAEAALECRAAGRDQLTQTEQRVLDLIREETRKERDGEPHLHLSSRGIKEHLGYHWQAALDALNGLNARRLITWSELGPRGTAFGRWVPVFNERMPEERGNNPQGSQAPSPSEAFADFQERRGW